MDIETIQGHAQTAQALANMVREIGIPRVLGAFGGLSNDEADAVAKKGMPWWFWVTGAAVIGGFAALKFAPESWARKLK